MKGNFSWVKIAEKIANKILEYKDKDEELMKIIQDIKVDEEINNEIEKVKVGDKLQEINNTDGFTAMNIIFMRSKNAEKSAKIIKKFEEKTGMDKEITVGGPDGIPYLRSERLRLTNGKEEEEELKNALWELFEIAIKYADNNTKENEEKFIEKFDNVYLAKEKCDFKVDIPFKKGLAASLYITRPNTYVPLDENTTKLVEKIYNKEINDGKSYVEMIQAVAKFIKENNNLEYKSIPEMSAFAFKTKLNSNIMNSNWYACGCKYDNVNMKEIFYEKNIFAVGWEEIGNLKNYADIEMLKAKIEEVYNMPQKRTITNVAKELNYFKQLKKNDIIVLKSASNKGENRKISFTRIFAIGKVSKDFEDGYKIIKGIGHTIPVEWMYEYGNGIDIDNLSLTGAILEIRPKDKKIINEIVIEGKNDIERSTDKIDLIKEDAIIEKGKNVLVYGVPGSGKSYSIDKKLENVDKEQKERVIFHPEYTYYEFVGQNVPDVNKGVRFEEGPFTRILKKALENPNENYYLIIEEMNRGNAEAIFGDLLQLLDRDESGRSQYDISNPILEQYLSQEAIYIPANLIIYATINNADQNVFNLDTAFGRRWEYEIKYCNPNEEEQDKKYINSVIRGTNVKWNDFREKINRKILDNSNEIYNAEDKRLGLYYIDRDCLAEENEEIQDEKKYREKFANKIFRYLWLDVFKNYRSEIFKDDNRCLEDIIINFKNNGKIEKILDIDLEEEENINENQL